MVKVTVIGVGILQISACIDRGSSCLGNRGRVMVCGHNILYERREEGVGGMFAGREWRTYKLSLYS